MNPSTQQTNEQDPSAAAKDDFKSPPSSCPKKPASKIGEDQTPGQANEGTVLDSIETAIERRIRSYPNTTLREMYTRISTFPVVLKEEREVCHFYISECIDYYRASLNGQSAAPSTSPTDGRSQGLSSRSSQTSAPSSTDGRVPSTLALGDSTDTIEVVLPDDKSKPVRSAKRDGRRSYISPAIVERCGLKEDTKSRVFVELRYTILVNNRGCMYRVPDCLFYVRDLKTDLAIGRDVQEKLEKQLGHKEHSYDPDSSTDDSVSIDRRQKYASKRARNVETSSHAGSGYRDSPDTATSKDFLDTFNRVLDVAKESRPEDTRVHENRHGRHHPPPSGSSGRSRRRHAARFGQ